MANDAVPVRIESLEGHDAESSTPDVPSRKGSVDCFGPAMGEPSSHTYAYHGRVTAALMHPSFFDDGEGNF